MYIDKYARPLVSRSDEPEHYTFPYITDESTAGTKYVCFDNTPKRVIWRYKTVSNVTTCEFAYGSWDQKASLTYAPINDMLEIDE